LCPLAVKVIKSFELVLREDSIGRIVFYAFYDDGKLASEGMNLGNKKGRIDGESGKVHKKKLILTE